MRERIGGHVKENERSKRHLVKEIEAYLYPHVNGVKSFIKNLLSLRVCGVVSIEANEAKQTTEPISCGVDIKVNPSRVVSFSSSPRLKLGFVNPLKNRGEEGNETIRDEFTLMSTPHDMGSVVCLGSVASLETTPHTLRNI
ncbi:hypothetical protein LXL04_022820 [Taraxacum kok-saghyz]